MAHKKKMSAKQFGKKILAAISPAGASRHGHKASQDDDDESEVKAKKGKTTAGDVLENKKAIKRGDKRG